MIKTRKLTAPLLAAAAATCLQLGPCGVEEFRQLVSNINPCGTILNCDPAAYLFAQSGIDGPGVSPDKDPFCTFPPFCTAAVDPIFGGLAP
ncbi:MAG: hypothetical protein U1D55_04750 [Phycisphaerae bacterium]